MSIETQVIEFDEEANKLMIYDTVPQAVEEDDMVRIRVTTIIRPVFFAFPAVQEWLEHNGWKR